MRQGKIDFNLGSADFQNLFGLLRVLLFFGILIFFASWFSTTFDGVVPVDVAQEYRKTVPLFSKSPGWFLVPFSAVVNAYSIRYMIAPLAAMILVIIAGAFFLKDVYELPTFGSALHYILASMFTIRTPKLIIDKGVKELKKGEINPIDRIGGPGFVLIEPGNAAIFRNLRAYSRSLISTTYFLPPFETIAHTVDLDEQQGDKDAVPAQTRDGIKVTLRDVHFRYRIKQEVVNGVPMNRSLQAPYPLAQDALLNMINNLQVREEVNGKKRESKQDTWKTAVERAVVGSIADFIASHSIDYLTAPRHDHTNPRIELQRLLFTGIQGALNNYGAELLWVDIGHIDIADDIVDKQRADLWASEWIGDAAVSRAYGEAKRAAYQELGRAEAQAKLIMGIAKSLDSVKLSTDSEENIRKILLARTAQVLDSLSSEAKKKS